MRQSGWLSRRIIQNTPADKEKTQGGGITQSPDLKLTETLWSDLQTAERKAVLQTLMSWSDIVKTSGPDVPHNRASLRYVWLFCCEGFVQLLKSYKVVFVNLVILYFYWKLPGETHPRLFMCLHLTYAVALLLHYSAAELVILSHQRTWTENALCFALLPVSCSLR